MHSNILLIMQLQLPLIIFIKLFLWGKEFWIQVQMLLDICPPGVGTMRGTGKRKELCVFGGRHLLINWKKQFPYWKVNHYTFLGRFLSTLATAPLFWTGNKKGSYKEMMNGRQQNWMSFLLVCTWVWLFPKLESSQKLVVHFLIHIFLIFKNT